MSRSAKRLKAPDHQGTFYGEVLNGLHDRLRPKSYLEIGTLHGSTLALAHCASIAIDPAFNITQEIMGKKPACHLYQMTSDDFFASCNPTSILGGPIDFAFLDGLHQFEFLLRDFINTEKHGSANSVVVIHDCLPTDVYVARRDPEDHTYSAASAHPEWWAGDVWKTLLILRQHRKDLRIHCLDSAPTGLVLVTNLNPASSTLSDDYAGIVKSWMDVGLADFGIDEFLGRCRLVDTMTVWEQDAEGRRSLAKFWA